MSKQEEFDKLYKLYWKYVYKYEVGHEDDFVESDWHKRDFNEQLIEW